MKLASPSRAVLDSLRRKLEFGDLIIFLYISVFVRQYLWVIGSNRLAWPLTIALSLLIWFWHLRWKRVEGRTPIIFWTVVALPLFFFYALRAALPDMSWDVLDYRLINGELGLSGWPVRANDFFPSRFPFNPAPDMVMGISRHLLGYRLGTIVNLGVLIWTGTILEKLLRPFLSRSLIRCLAVLLLLLTEQLLFQVNNYMVDLLALPLLLEGARLALELPKSERDEQRRALTRIGLYLGAALAFKLTNLAFIAPIVLFVAYRVWRGKSVRDPLALVYALLALVVPLIPYTLFIYWDTGNPIFPLYNWVFQSPYWPAPDLRPERWGPVVDDASFNSLRIWERLIWPLLLPFRVEHTAGDLGPHWGRVSIGFLASIAALLWRRADASVRFLAFVTLLGSIIWAMASGMLRYVAFVEVAGGAVALYLIIILWGRMGATLREGRLYRQGAAFLLTLALATQSVSSCVYAFAFEFGSRPSFFQQPGEHLYEARFFFRDRKPNAFLSDEERALFAGVDVWVESAPLTGGLQLALRPEAPLWCVYMDEFLQSDVARRRFALVQEQLRGRRIYTLCLTDWLKFAQEKLQSAGFGIGSMKIISLPYYSDRARFHTMLLMEVLPKGQAPVRELSITQVSGPLPVDDLKAMLVWAERPPERMRPNERRTVRVVLKHMGQSVWPALSQAGGHYPLLAGNHWLDRDGGRTIIQDDGRSPLPYDLAPNDSIELPLTITAPSAKGEYILEVDMVQEGVTWFAAKGSQTLRTRIIIEE